MQVQSTELHKYRDEREQMPASDKQQQIQTDNTADSADSYSGFRQRKQRIQTAGQYHKDRADSDICRFKFRQMQVQSTELHKYKDEREQMQTDAASDKQQQIQTDNTADSDSSRFSGNSGFRQRDNITKIGSGVGVGVMLMWR
ncbi:hypothetical protein Tco_0926878 [Tanacetum coccineum]|uniref:Uncharacterized protein n=1 Tax=Tanacetum coccineum TaxID=301880 RepID=A0ABQ5DI14_9ASTR